MPRLTPANANDAPVQVTIYSDVICPWCFIGKRRFEAALRSPGMPQDVAITWRPFELNPGMPEDGMERAAYRAAKFGAEKSAALDKQMAETGREAGISFAFDKMKRTPNTRLAHRVIWEAERQGRQDALVERLFDGYFQKGLDIGSKEILLAEAQAAGLSAAGVQRALDNEESLEAVLDLEDAGLRMGIQGVPFFILMGKYAISGAQPPELWRDALPKIVAESAQA